MRAMTMFGTPAELIDAHHLAAADAVTQMDALPIRFDLLSSLSGVTFEQAVTETVRVEIADEILPVIGGAIRKPRRCLNFCAAGVFLWSPVTRSRHPRGWAPADWLRTDVKTDHALRNDGNASKPWFQAALLVNQERLQGPAHATVYNPQAA